MFDSAYFAYFPYGSTAYSMKLLCCDVLNFSKYSTITLTCIILVLCTQLPESAVEAFYWYNGSIFYTFFFSLMLLFFSCIINQLFIKKDKKCITAPLLSVIIAEGVFPPHLSAEKQKSGVTAAKINSWVYRQTEPAGGILPACSLCNTPHKKT